MSQDAFFVKEKLGCWDCCVKGVIALTVVFTECHNTTNANTITVMSYLKTRK